VRTSWPITRRAPVGARETRENADQGGLAGSIGPSSPKNSPAGSRGRSRERLLLAEALVDVADFDRGSMPVLARAKDQLEAD